MKARLDEVAEALSIEWRDPAHPYFDSASRLFDVEDVLEMCSCLVTTTKVALKNEENSLRQEVREIRLAHFSVKEFLVSERNQHSPISRFSLADGVAHNYIAQRCIVYLLQLILI